MRAGQGIIVISITLLMLGVVMVNSAGMQVSADPIAFSDLLLERPTILAFFAIVAMFVGSRFPLKWLQRQVCSVPLVVWLFAIAILLLFGV